MKKITALILAAVCLLALSSCGKKDGKNKDADTEAAYELSLLFSQTDSLNPYAAKSEQNRKLGSLLYDPLYKYDDQFNPIPCLASSYKRQDNTFTVTLRKAKFSDGTAVTSADVIYSLSLARESQTAGYTASLSEISDCSAPDSATVVFTLSKNDPYFLNLLTFPVLKENSAGLTDNDGVEIPPIGSGRFVAELSKNRFVRNDKHFEKAGAVKYVNLLAAPDKEAAAHYVQAGSIDLYYTSSDSDIVRMSGTRYDIEINHLVYIGVNSSYGALKDKEMRYAISSAINRGDIVKSAYYNRAQAAGGFFNPAFKDTQSTATIKPSADIDISIENLAKMGYNIKDEEGYYTSAAGYRAGATLLVNEDNVSRVAAAGIISSNAKAAGIEITVEAVPFKEYKRRISLGNFQLYLGEISVGANMDLKGLTVPGGSAAAGVTESAGSSQMTVSSAYAAYESGQIGITALSGVLLTEMPQIPVCYRKGSLFYGDRIKSGVEGLYCDIYYSIASYQF